MTTFRKKLQIMNIILKYNFAHCKNPVYFKELSPLRDRIFDKRRMIDSGYYTIKKVDQELLKLFNKYFKMFYDIYKTDGPDNIIQYFEMLDYADGKKLIQFLNKYENI